MSPIDDETTRYLMDLTKGQGKIMGRLDSLETAVKQNSQDAGMRS